MAGNSSAAAAAAAAKEQSIFTQFCFVCPWSADLNENEYSCGFFGVHGESRAVFAVTELLMQKIEDTRGAASFIS